jgi:phosphatidylglycerol:prolipoprotein diacylglycerol transferase
MIPVLLSLPYLKLYTFGVFLVLAFFWGSYLLWKNVLLTSYKEEDMFDGMFIGLFGGVVIGRLFYVVTHSGEFGYSILKIILINGYPGFLLYGFLVGALLTWYLFAKSKKIRFGEMMDYIIPPVLLALGFGKLGSFFSGVEFGTRTKLPLSLKVAGVAGAHHLTPLYESLLFFAGCFFTYKILFAIRREQYAKGFNLSFFIWFFAFVEVILDPIKSNRVLLYRSFSFNFVLSAVLLLTFSFYFLYYFRNQISKLLNINGKNHGKSIHKQTKGSTGKGEK